MHLLQNKSPRKVWLIGHRGAMGHAPENSMASFALAQKMGADLVECDVHLSLDKKCVVMHDESVERTTPSYGLIRDLPAKKITSLDCGRYFSRKYKGERVPTLKKLLLWARETLSLQGLPMGVAIEIKNEPVRYFQIEKVVVETVLQTRMLERVIVICFDHGTVKRAKKIEPRLFTGILYNQPLEDPIRRAKEMHANAIFPHRNLVTRNLVKKAQLSGIGLFTWTVNEIQEMKKLIACEVDGIATNFPDRLNRLLK